MVPEHKAPNIIFSIDLTLFDTFCRNHTLIYKSCQVRVCRSWHNWDFKLWLQQSWKIAFAFRPWISWAMRRWPWISCLLAVFCLQGCSSNDKPSKESTCFLTIGGVGLAYKKDCSSSKLVETDLPYPVRWKILQDENLGDFNVWMFQGLFFSLPKEPCIFLSAWWWTWKSMSILCTCKRDVKR